IAIRLHAKSLFAKLAFIFLSWILYLVLSYNASSVWEKHHGTLFVMCGVAGAVVELLLAWLLLWRKGMKLWMFPAAIAIGYIAMLPRFQIDKLAKWDLSYYSIWSVIVLWQIGIGWVLNEMGSESS